MKKLLLFIVLSLTACSHNIDQPTLHVFYSETCSECQLLEEKFLPLVHDAKIILYNIDKKENIQLYQKYLNTLDNIDASLYHTPLTPFIYMEDGFGAIGYSEIMRDVYINLIDETIQEKEYSIVPSGVWLCKEE